MIKKVKDVHIVGGYAAKHLFCYLLNEKSEELKDLKNDFKFHFYVGQHFTQHITNEKLLKHAWGQKPSEFPSHSFGALENASSDDWLTFGQIKQWNNSVEKEMLSLGYIIYKKIDIKVLSEVEQIFQIELVDINGNEKTEIIDLSENCYLLDCRVVPRIPDRDEFLQFRTRSEDFYINYDELTTKFTEIPFLIMGSGPSAVWVYEVLSPNYKDVKFVSVNYRFLEQFRDNPRNNKISNQIISLKPEMPGSVVWKLGMLQRSRSLQNFWKAAEERLFSLTKKSSLDQIPGYQDLAAVFTISEQNKSFELEIRKVILCIGYDVVKVETKSQFYKNFAVSTADQLKDIFPVTIFGSVQHQLSKGIRILQNILTNNKAKGIWRIAGLTNLAFTEDDQKEIKKQAKEKNILLEDTFFEILKANMNLATIDVRHLKETEMVVGLCLWRTYDKFLDILLKPLKGDINSLKKELSSVFVEALNLAVS